MTDRRKIEDLEQVAQRERNGPEQMTQLDVAPTQIPRMAVAIETVTPDRAEAILAHNHSNRRVRWTVVDRYAHDMTTGAWRAGVGSIALDQSGNLVDGQHRLHACVKAGVPFETVIIRGVADDAQVAMDVGLHRRLGDVLGFRGETNTNALAAAVSKGWQWSTGTLAANLRPTHAEALAWLERNPSIRDANNRANRVRKNVMCPQANLSAVIHQITMIDSEEAEAFLTKLASGEQLDAGDPILAARNWMFNFSTKMAKPAPLVYMAIIIKAWNFWLSGKRTNNLVWRRGGHNREEFPELRDLDGNVWAVRDEM